MWVALTEWAAIGARSESMLAMHKTHGFVAAVHRAGSTLANVTIVTVLQVPMFTFQVAFQGLAVNWRSLHARTWSTLTDITAIYALEETIGTILSALWSKTTVDSFNFRVLWSMWVTLAQRTTVGAHSETILAVHGTHRLVATIDRFHGSVALAKVATFTVLHVPMFAVHVTFGPVATVHWRAFPLTRGTLADITTINALQESVFAVHVAAGSKTAVDLRLPATFPTSTSSIGTSVASTKVATIRTFHEAMGAVLTTLGSAATVNWWFLVTFTDRTVPDVGLVPIRTAHVTGCIRTPREWGLFQRLHCLPAATHLAAIFVKLEAMLTEHGTPDVRAWYWRLFASAYRTPLFVFLEAMFAVHEAHHVATV